MKKILTTTLLSLVFIFCTSSLYSQYFYNKAVGLRGGIGATVTYKNFISDFSAFEGIIGLYDRNNNFGLALLYERHNPLDFARLQWYWGVGGYSVFNSNKTNLGIVGALGLDLSIGTIPLNFSLDWLPRIRLSGGGTTLSGSGGGLAIRYILDYDD